MRHELTVLPDAEAVARGAAEHLAARIRRAVAERGASSVAISGGRTPWAMLAELRALPEIPWAALRVYQVDERLAQAGIDQVGCSCRSASALGPNPGSPHRPRVATRRPMPCSAPPRG